MDNLSSKDISSDIEFISIDLDDYQSGSKKVKVRRIDSISDKYLEFYSAILPNRKTPVIAVYNKLSKEVIGEIKWYPPWRQYCFFPEDETIYHDGCLNKITECMTFLKSQKENKDGKCN